MQPARGGSEAEGGVHAEGGVSPTRGSSLPIVPVAIAVLLASACMHRPIGAQWPFAGPELPPVVLTILGDGPRPRDVRLLVRAPDGAITSEDPCFGDGADACRTSSDWYRGPGLYELEMRYRAVDGVEESRRRAFVAHGDELALHFQGYFGADGSSDGVSPLQFVRRAAGVSLVRGNGIEPDRIVNVGPSAVTLHLVDEQPVAYLWRVEASGVWAHARFGPLQIVCGGMGARSRPGAARLEPGASFEVSSMRTRAPLPPGHYVHAFYVRETEPTHEALAQTAHPLEARAVVVDRLTVPPIEPVAESDWSFGPAFRTESFAREYPRISRRAPALSRPGASRPHGLEGGGDHAAAPLVSDGVEISGVLSAERPRHVYRVAARSGDLVVLRLYARCLASPCDASIERRVLYARQRAPLRRVPPAWSTVSLQAEAAPGPGTIEVSCGETCAEGASEFYGRVHALPRAQ